MFKTLAVWLLLAGSVIGFEGTASDWGGFKKVAFEVDGRHAFVVLPKKPAKGNPWVWRARFFGWHSAMDRELLAKGVAIGYIDVANLYGSPKAVAHWDAFHAFMVSNGMSPRPAIEAVSRGGLIAFNWAKRNPKKVACIYVEAPVCDIKSWPGGFGTGLGSSNDWKMAQAAYGLDGEGLAAWNDNPLDHLEELAAAKVPIRASIGLRDRVVPPDENFFRLMNRYVHLGGPVCVFPMTEGRQKLNGHHFPIEHPERIAAFILSNLNAKGSG